MPTIRDKVKSALSGTAASEKEDVGEQEEKIARLVELARMVFSKYRLEGAFTISNSQNQIRVSTAQSVKVKITKSEWTESLPTSLEEDDDSANDDNNQNVDQAVQAAEAAVSLENSEENLVRIQKTVLALMKKLVKDLMKRAVKYKNKSYMNNLELSSKATVSGPVVGWISIAVTFSATAQALLESRDYRETYKSQRSTDSDVKIDRQIWA